jgi:hypothetical protein
LNKRLLYLDSVNRTSGTVNDLVFDIHPQIEHVVGYEIVDFDIGKNPIYNITAECNDFRWEDTAANVIDSTIPIGGYTNTELANEMATQMNADAVAVDAYTVVYDAITGKFTITEDSDTFELTTTFLTDSLYTKIGFSTAADKTGATSYVGDSLVDINSLYFIYLKSRSITNILLDAPRDAGCLTNSIHRVKIDVPFGGDINKNDIQFPIFINCNSNKLSLIDIQVVDRLGIPVELNGMEWSMTLQVFYEHKHVNMRHLRG